MALVRILNLDTGEWNIVPNISGVDLSNYYTKTEIDSILSSEIDNFQNKIPISKEEPEDKTEGNLWFRIVEDIEDIQ